MLVSSEESKKMEWAMKHNGFLHPKKQENVRKSYKKKEAKSE